MIGWVIFACYVIAGLFVARKATIAIIAHLDKDIGGADTEDRFMGRMMGLIAGAAWPLILLGAVIGWRLPKTDRELRNDLAARDRRIAELEREAGIS